MSNQLKSSFAPLHTERPMHFARDNATRNLPYKLVYLLYIYMSSIFYQTIRIHLLKKFIR